MAPHVQMTYLATIFMIPERSVSYLSSPSPTLAFQTVANISQAVRTSSSTSHKQRVRVRPRPVSSHVAATPTSTAADTPEGGRGKKAVPTLGRLTHPDIDTTSLNLALLKLREPVRNPPLKKPPRQASLSPSGERQTPSEAGGLDYAVVNWRATRERDEPDTLAEVQRLVLKGRIAEAVEVLERIGNAKTVSTVTSSTKFPPATRIKEADVNKDSLVVGFIAVLEGCANRGMWHEARQVVVKHMPIAGITPSREAWVLAVDACSGPGGSEQAVYLLHEMRSRGVQLDVAVYEVAVRACTRSGDIARAIFLLKDASKRGMPIPPYCIACIMRAVINDEITGWQHALSLYGAFLKLMLSQGQSAMEPGLGTNEGELERKHRGDVTPRAMERMQWLSEFGPQLEEVCQAALEACTKGGQWQRALEVLNTLRAGGSRGQLSRIAYDKAIDACGKAGAWEMVLLVVAEMRADAIAMSPATFETTLQACAATGSWSWARSLLHDVREDGPDGVTLSARHYCHALRACAAVVDKPGGKGAQGAVRFALALVEDLRQASWLKGQPGEDAYVCAMQTCVRAQDAWSALALLDSAQDAGMRLGVALRTTAMQALGGAGEWRAALSILEDMLAEGLHPGGIAYVAAMEACARGGVIDNAIELLEKILREHPSDKETVSAAYHGAITACAECGHWEEATSLLKRMRQDPLVMVTAAEYNAAILACCRARQSFAALSLLGNMSLAAGAGKHNDPGMSTTELRPDETSYNHVMRAFAQEGRWRTVIDLLISMRDEGGLIPGVSTYNFVVLALAKGGQWQQALQMLEEMERKGVRPTEFTYTCCMQACGKLGRWQEALSLMSKMKEQEDLVPDSYAYSTVMLACSRAGQLDHVLSSLEEMRTNPGRGGPNLVHYNIAIAACARARKWERMLREIERMKWEEVTPTETTFATPMDACARAGDLSVALTLLSHMHECGVPPGVVTYSSAVAAACRGSDAASVERLLDEMSAAGHTPNDVTYAVAVLACRDGANADAAVTLLRRSKEQGLGPDALVYGFAVQACCNARDFERGLELVRKMKREGIVPDGEFYNSVIAGVSASFSLDPGE